MEKRLRFYTLRIQIAPKNKAAMDCWDEVEQKNNGTKKDLLAMLG